MSLKKKPLSILGDLNDDLNKPNSKLMSEERLCIDVLNSDCAWCFDRRTFSVKHPARLSQESTLLQILQADNVDKQDKASANSFKPQPVQIETVILTKSVGVDGIALRFLRDSLPAVAYYLTVIINTSLVTGDFPSLWKHGIITPVLKSGDKDEVNNYRPITILPMLSKVLEEIVADQLTIFLDT
nr:uncharacterized protein LOC113815354 [Penaeus vannamei]